MIYFIGTQERLFESDIKKSSIKDCLEYFKDHKRLMVDSETTGFDPHTKDLLCIQIGDDVNQYVIQNFGGNISTLKRFLESKELVFHNAKFDLKFLYKQGIYPRKVFCTYLAESIINQGIQVKKSLQAVCYKYLKINLDKSVRGIIHSEGFSDKVIRYCADDVKYLFQIMDIQNKEVKNQKREGDLKIQNNFCRSLAYIEYCGLNIDKDLWRSKCISDKKNLLKKERVLNDSLISLKHPQFSFVQGDLFGESTPLINWMSPKQVIPVFKYLGVNTETKNPKGKIVDSIEETVIGSYKNKIPFVNTYLEYRKAEKVCSTYGENFFQHINPFTHRIHTQYKQLVDSGRTSSGGKDKDNKVEWINHQNIPRDEETKQCFVPEKGNKMVIADYSGQETVVLVNDSLEPKMLEFFKSGENDMHSYVARQVYPELKELSLEEIKEKFSDKRYQAKQGAFSILYGATPFTISTQLKCTLEEAEKFYEEYFAAFGGIKEFFKKCHSQALKDGYILIDELTGAKYFIPYFEEFKELEKEFKEPGFWDRYRSHKQKNSTFFQSVLKPKVSKYFRKKGEIERISVNFRIQGKSALISKVACVLFFDWILDNNYFWVVKIPAFIHDEILAEAPEKIIQEVKVSLENCMKKAGSYWCKTVPLKAEGIIADSWADK